MKFKNYFRRDRKTVSVVRLNGMIATGRGLNDAGLAPVLEKAFAKKPAAVALVINSPGGSPVQSSLIGARIRRLADENKIPVYAFVEDVAASVATGWQRALMRFLLMRRRLWAPLV